MYKIAASVRNEYNKGKEVLKQNFAVRDQELIYGTGNPFFLYKFTGDSLTHRRTLLAEPKRKLPYP